MAGSVRKDRLIFFKCGYDYCVLAQRHIDLNPERTYGLTLYHTKLRDECHRSHMDLHVLNTPFMTLRSSTSAFVLLLKVFLLEPVSSICDGTKR